MKKTAKEQFLLNWDEGHDNPDHDGLPTKMEKDLEKVIIEAQQQVKDLSLSDVNGSLPTDEDIEKVAKGYDNSMSSMSESIWMPEGFKKGAKWMREKLTGR